MCTRLWRDESAVTEGSRAGVSCRLCQSEPLCRLVSEVGRVRRGRLPHAILQLPSPVEKSSIYIYTRKPCSRQGGEHARRDWEYRGGKGVIVGCVVLCAKL